MNSTKRPEHVVFLHIPKTAGTTLIKILRRRYGRGNIFSIYGDPTSNDANRFCALPQERRDQIKLLQGHWSFGLHPYFSGETRYISVMRDPLERMISLYYYILRLPTHYLYEQVTSRNLSLDEFLMSDLTAELDNGQLRMLAGCEKTVPFGEIRQEHLELANSNIDTHFAVVGLTKRFDETLLLFKHTLGWKRNPYYHRRNVTASRPSVKAAKPETVKLVLERNRFEIELFEWVKERFEKQIAEFPGGFDQELSRFGYCNELYQRWMVDLRRPKWMLTLQQRLKK